VTRDEGMGEKGKREDESLIIKKYFELGVVAQRLKEVSYDIYGA